MTTASLPALGDDPDRLMLQEEVCAHLGGITPRTLRKWTAQGIGPKPVRLGGKLVRYRVGDYREWVATCARAGTGDTAA